MVVLLYKRLAAMGRWMESHFHVWIDYYGVAFSMDFLIGVEHIRLANVPECLYCTVKSKVFFVQYKVDT